MNINRSVTNLLGLCATGRPVVNRMWALLAVMAFLCPWIAKAQAPSPTLQASAVSFANVSGTGMDINWTAGDGTNHLVVVRKGAPVNAFPTNATSYTAGTAVTNGSQVGVGNFVVYNSTNASVTVTNLTVATNYFVAVFEFNGSGGQQTYLTNTLPATNSQATSLIAPTVDASAVNFSSVFQGAMDHQMTVNWTSGNGARRIVVANAGSPPTGLPVNGTTYLTNNTYGTGSTLSDGSYVVYNGSGASVTVSGLSALTTYYFEIFEYNGVNGSETFYTTGTPATGSQATTALNVYWGLTNFVAGTGGNMSAGGSWVGAVAPTTANDAVVYSTNGVFNLTNDASFAGVQDLYYIFGNNAAGDGQTVLTRINPGTTLSVLGPNGFIITRNPGVKANFTYTFTGNAMLVTNLTARFVLNSGQSSGGSSSKSQTINFSALTNLTVGVDLFGGANNNLAGGVSVGDESAKINLARTNIITALHKDDYTQLDFTNSVEIGRNTVASASTALSQNSFFELGFSNAFYADSIGIGRGGWVGGSTLPTSVSTMLTVNQSGGANSAALNFEFSPAVSNSAAPVAVAVFRNTNGVDRVSLMAIGVDSGTNTLALANAGAMFLKGGKVDMLVDQVWLGRNRTNGTSKYDAGALGFDNGTVDANTVIAGYMQFTNPVPCGGFLEVGTAATMKINNYLQLGYTPVDAVPIAANATAEAGTLGLVQVDNGGQLLVNTISVGAGSTGNAITANGTLVVSNTIASSTKGVTTLTVGATGQLTFSASPGVTNAFVTNLVSSAGAKINIASAPLGSQASYVLINYQGGAHSSFTVGSLPAGIGGAQITDNGANIIMTLSTNAPKNLVWRGTQDGNWNHTSTNWLDLVGGTNTAFTDGDQVQFDDAGGIPTTINITDTVLPSQIGFGILMTNNVNNYVFSGAGSIINASMVKAGTASLIVNLPTTLNMTATQGTFELDPSGTVNNLTAGSACLFTNAGVVSITATCSGTVLNAGAITNISLSGSSIMTNYPVGHVGKNLSMGSGTKLYNYGGFDAIGSTTVSSGAYLYNAGYIAGGTLSISGTFEDTGTGVYPPAYNNYSLISSLALSGGLAINSGGTFIPGGDGIGTTVISEFPSGAVIPPNNSPAAAAGPVGLLKLNPGSTNIFKINLDSGVQNTAVQSIFLSVGQAQTQPAVNGSTIVIINTGATQLSAGQNLTLFANTYGGAIGYTGTNVLTSYPLMSPAIPGAGLAWVEQKIPTTGVISVVNKSSLQSLVQLSGVPAFIGTNLVANLSWPSDYTGGWLQTLVAPLSSGLAATNWVQVANTYGVNSVSITNSSITNGVVFFRFFYP